MGQRPRRRQEPRLERAAGGVWRGAAEPADRLARRRPQPRPGDLRRVVWLRLSPPSPHRPTVHHRWQADPHRQSVMDAVCQRRQLQRTDRLLPSLLLVARHARQAGARRPLSRRPPRRAEQGGADGDAICPRRPGGRRQGRLLRPHRPHLLPAQRRQRVGRHPPDHRLRQDGTVGLRQRLVRRRRSCQRHDRPGRFGPPPLHRRRRLNLADLCSRRAPRGEGGLGVELLCHADRPRRPHLRLPLERRNSDRDRLRHRPACHAPGVLPAREGEGEVGVGRRGGEGCPGRDGARRGRVSHPPGPAGRALRHPRQSRQSVEDPRPRRRPVRNAPR